MARSRSRDAPRRRRIVASQLALGIAALLAWHESSSFLPFGERPFADAERQRSLRSRGDGEGATTTATTTEKRKKSRMLLGIFSSAEGDVDRRRLIRDTYLNSEKDDPRVCSLPDYVRSVRDGSNKSEEKDGAEEDECQIAYTFVMAKRPEPNEDDDNDGRSTPLYVEEDEEDGTYLDLPQETDQRDDDGRKTMAAFLERVAASSWIDEGDFDYVVRTDSDAFIDLQGLFRFVDESLPPRPEDGRTPDGRTPDDGRRRIYAGCASGSFCALSVDLVADLVSFATSSEASNRRGEPFPGRREEYSD